MIGSQTHTSGLPIYPYKEPAKARAGPPPNWTSISDVISRAMDAHTPGIKLVHPNRTSTHRTIDAFVDDTNSGLTQDALRSFSPPSASALVPKHDTIYNQTTANVQFYSDLLSSSGGKLALHKSYV